MCLQLILGYSNLMNDSAWADLIDFGWLLISANEITVTLWNQWYVIKPRHCCSVPWAAVGHLGTERSQAINCENVQI